jgi:hypothetical protein
MFDAERFTSSVAPAIAANDDGGRHPEVLADLDVEREHRLRGRAEQQVAAERNVALPRSSTRSKRA